MLYEVITVDGNNIFPSQIEALLFEMEGVEPHFQILLTRNEGLTAVELMIEVTPDFFSFDEIKSAENFKKQLSDLLSTSVITSYSIHYTKLYES